MQFFKIIETKQINAPLSRKSDDLLTESDDLLTESDDLLTSENECLTEEYPANLLTNASNEQAILHIQRVQEFFENKIKEGINGGKILHDNVQEISLDQYTMLKAIYGTIFQTKGKIRQFVQSIGMLMGISLKDYVTYNAKTLPQQLKIVVEFYCGPKKLNSFLKNGNYFLKKAQTFINTSFIDNIERENAKKEGNEIKGKKLTKGYSLEEQFSLFVGKGNLEMQFFDSLDDLKKDGKFDKWAVYKKWNEKVLI